MIKIKRFLDYKKCIKCNREFLIVDTKKINDKEYICRDCSYERGYTTKNTQSRGKPTQATFSIEFETSKRDDKLLELIKYGFIGCSDSSIGGREWKSQIYNNKKSFHADCKKLDKFKEFVGNDCGTHIHCGTKHKEIIQIYREEIFKPLLEEMENNIAKTRKFWGRYFSHYCERYIRNHDRFCAINVWSSVETIEYRLLKFKNAKQYIKVADFCIDTTKYINFCISKGDFNCEKAKKLGLNILKKYKEVNS